MNGLSSFVRDGRTELEEGLDSMPVFLSIVLKLAPESKGTVNLPYSVIRSSSVLAVSNGSSCCLLSFAGVSPLMAYFREATILS